MPTNRELSLSIILALTVVTVLTMFEFL